MGSLSLVSENGNQVKVFLQNFVSRAAGPTLTLMCERGDEFLEVAKKRVRELEHVNDDEEVFFCFYAIGTQHRIEIKECDLFWTIFDRIVSPVYFWVGKRPESPTKVIEELREEIADVRDQLQREKLVSTAQSMQNEFDKHIEWKVKVLEHWLRGNVNPIKVTPLKKTGLEPPVQLFWVETLKSFKNIVDTHSVCPLVGRDGTRHKPDLTMIVGPSVVWEKVDRILEIKPSITSASGRRDVVVQVFSRMIEVLDHQPKREVVYGAGLDHGHVCFVKATRKLEVPLERELYVSQCLKLFDGAQWSEHGKLFLRFLNLGPEDCGFVEVQLPMVLNVQMQSVLCRRMTTTLFIAEKVVYKTSPSILEEVAFMKRLAECQPPVCPALLDWDESALAMELGQDSRSVEDLDLQQLAQDLFWAIFHLHDRGVCHGDIKPSNVVLLRGRFCLIDFDAAVDVDEKAERKRLTEVFAASTLLQELDCTDWDLVGLFWTVTFFYGREEEGDKWRKSRWNDDGRYKWGHQMIDFQDSLLRRAGVVPDSSVKPLRLVHPKEHMKAYFELKDGCKDPSEWIMRVRQHEKERGWFSCPKQILECWFLRKEV
jgi:hypothetical protein